VKLTRNFLLNATLLQALTLPMLLAPSFAQQEIDPTWHDPAAVTTPASAHTAKAATANAKKTDPARSRTLSANKQQASKHESNATTQSRKPAANEASIVSSL
jgi:hypothetical protein